MKNTLFLIFLILLCGQIKAQKLEKPAIDKITGETVVKTSSERIFVKTTTDNFSAEQLSVSVVKTKDEATLVFAIKTRKTTMFSMDRDAKASITLEDHSMLTLSTPEGTSANYDKGTHGAAADVEYLLTPDDIAKLKKSNVVSVKLESSVGDFEYEIKDKLSSIVKDELALFRN